MLRKPWQIVRDSGRLVFSFALVSCYLLSVLGGSLHFVLHHALPHGETAYAADTLPAYQSDCDDEQHGATKVTCHVCVSLARSVGTAPMDVAVAATARAATADLPLSTPAPTMPFRPHSQRGPPVQV